MVSAVRTQTTEDGTGGICRYHYVAFVDMPLAVLSLAAFPPVCYLSRWSTNHIRVEVIDPFPPTQELPEELLTDKIDPILIHKGTLNQSMKIEITPSSYQATIIDYSQQWKQIQGN